MQASTKITITRMGAGHTAAMAEVDKVCFAEPWSEQAFISELSNPLAVYYVALGAGGELLGYAGMQIVAGEGYITNIAVLHAHRKSGLGRRLLTVLLDLADGCGLAAVMLEVRESNTPARRLYGSSGFVDVGRRRGFYRLPTEDAILMTRPGPVK